MISRDTEAKKTDILKKTVLLLSRVPGLGPKTIFKSLHLIQQNEIQAEYSDILKALIQTPIAKRHIDFLESNFSALKSECSELEERLNEIGISVITLWDSDYPMSLKAYDSQPPPVLYAYGNLGLLKERKFAVVNSNNAPDYSLSLTSRVVDALINTGKVLVTGHNRHPYQLAALTAKRLGAPVITVLDRGIVSAFKGRLEWELFAEARIWNPQFDKYNDLVISPFRLGDSWIGNNSKQRDHLIFALSETIVTVYVRSGGVMEKESLYALSVGREVFASAGLDANHLLMNAGCLVLDPDNAYSQLASASIEEID